MDDMLTSVVLLVCMCIVLMCCMVDNASFQDWDQELDRSIKEALEESESVK